MGGWGEHAILICRANIRKVLMGGEVSRYNNCFLGLLFFAGTSSTTHYYVLASLFFCWGQVPFWVWVKIKPQGTG